MKRKTNPLYHYDVSESENAIYLTYEPKNEATSDHYVQRYTSEKLEDAIAYALMLSFFQMKPIWSAYVKRT